jgi:putative colanic acid biosynthesis glycosyltransferase WcaI
MRIVVADYSGHPFQVQLSRQLARRGHSVLHLHFAEFQTPKSRLNVEAGDPPSLSIEAISLGRPFAKYNFVKRRFQEVAVGKLFANRISAFEADVVLASNLPLDSLQIVAMSAVAKKQAFIVWQQDIYSIAIETLARDRWGWIGSSIGKYYKWVERNVLRYSQAIVAISEDFLPYLEGEFGIVPDNVHVIENWAPLDEITPRIKDNEWARANGLADKDVVLYSGTLGMKHDPGQILSVALDLRDRPNTEIVVASEGPSAEWLIQESRVRQLSSFRVMGFQPYAVYPDVLGTADVLLSILDDGSGVFSVPSKVLSYLCAGRSIVLSAPEENLAARTVKRSGAGYVVPPGRAAILAKTIRALLDNPRERKIAAECGRRHAQNKFDIQSIGDQFEEIIFKARRKIDLAEQTRTFALK